MIGGSIMVFLFLPFSVGFVQMNSASKMVHKVSIGGMRSKVRLC